MTECFAIFEGGGAKGLAHVGALKAAEEAQLEFVGVAGASAGAIIAALIATGFRADDLYNPTPGTRSLFGDLDWIGILGADRWQQFRTCQRDAERILPRTGSPGLGTAWRARRFFKRWSAQIGTTATRHGFFTTQAFEEWLNGVLCDRLGFVRRQITFDDLNARGVIPLKLVSVDIAAQTLVVFSHLDSPNIPVAKAVAASISIPFFFAPTEVQGRAMVDGGLMSNFPAWLFESERMLHPPFLRTYGFTLLEANDGMNPPEDPLHMLLDYGGFVIRTGIFGGQSLMNESIEFLQAVPIRTTFSVLAFELNTNQKTALYQEGYNSARDFFHNQGVTDDAAVTVALMTLTNELQARLARPNARLRANVMLPVKRSFLRVMYSFNMQEDTDDRLLLRQDQTGAGQAFSQCRTVITDMRTIWQGRIIPGMSKYDAALVRNGLVSLISVPIFRADIEWQRPWQQRTPPRAILNFDCDDDIVQSFNQMDVQEFIIQASIVVGRLLSGEMR